MAYFDHTIDGVALDLAHLEPRALTFFVQRLARELAIDVWFSNHCFTVAFEDGRHDPAHLILDHRLERAVGPRVRFQPMTTLYGDVALLRNRSVLFDFCTKYKSKNCADN